MTAVMQQLTVTRRVTSGNLLNTPATLAPITLPATGEAPTVAVIVNTAPDIGDEMVLAGWNTAQGRADMVQKIAAIKAAGLDIAPTRRTFYIGHMAYGLAKRSAALTLDITVELVQEATNQFECAARTVKNRKEGQAYRSEHGDDAYNAAKTAFSSLVSATNPPKPRPKKTTSANIDGPSPAKVAELAEAKRAVPVVGTLKDGVAYMVSDAAIKMAMLADSPAGFTTEMRQVIESYNKAVQAISAKAILAE